MTSLSSLFPAEEAQKASKRVQDTVAKSQKELHQLRGFIADNTSLINLVQRLPDELHHQIMVPFGKAAFFPGQLIHTNEFLVLLGEGYYAERTSKQTVEILKRRGKQLDSQVESLKAVMEDLKAEASFFDTTAAEAAEGFVEIREDYVEETSNEKVLMAGVPKSDSASFSETDNEKAEVKDEDEEYARILSRIEELEKEEEEEAENANQVGEDVLNDVDVGHSMSQLSVDHEAHHASKTRVQLKPDITEKEPSQKHFQQVLSNQLNFEGSKVHPVSKVSDGLPHGKSPASNESSSVEKALKLPKEDNVQAAPATKNEAFTGSIIEHTHNLAMNRREQTVPPSSKPVSRFKMQRR